jgi:transcriptional regulator with XRE-family HTH domain
LDKRDLAAKLGYNVSSFSQIINGRVPISDKFIERFLNFATMIDEKWLLTGEGDMLTQSPASLVIHDATAEQYDHSGVPLQLVSTEVIEEIKEEIKKEEAIPVISPEVANKPNENVRLYIEENSGELEHINPSELLKGADAAERVLRSSMSPSFIPSDIVFLRFLHNKTKIVDGNIYYFDLKTRPTMIRKVKLEGDKLRLIDENPDFGDVITDFSDILNVADIVGMLRTTFSTQYSEIEAVRRKKDEQVDSLIQEVGKAGIRVDKMMEQMTELVKHTLSK